MPLTLNGTTGITFPNGSAGTPALTGVDTDSGVIFGTNTVALATAGTQRLTIDSTGNVGIATAIPTAPLHIFGALANTAEIRLQSSDGRTYAVGSTGSGYGAANKFIIYDITGAAERLCINSSGNLGLGTTVPRTKLDINGGGYFTGFDNPTSSGRAGLELGYDGSKGVIQSYDRLNNLWKDTSYNASTHIFGVGNVGIGITNPSQKFVVSGNIQAYRGDSRPYIYMNFDTTPANGAAHGRLTVYKSNQNSYSGKVHIQPQYYTGSTYDYLENALVVDATGNIGIGVASPGYRLDIDGGSQIIRAGGTLYLENPGLGRLGYLTTTSQGTTLSSFNGFGEPLYLIAPASTAFISLSTAGSEKLRIDPSGRMVQNGAVLHAAGGNANINSTFSIDVTVRDDSGSGNGGAYKVFAGITHVNFTSYGAVYEAWVACRGTSVNESLTQNNTTSGQGGSWSVSKPNNTTLRVTHTGGSLSALGNYFVFVLAAS